MKIIRSFEPGDRYRYDFDLCSCARGWAQVDTAQDALSFGTWASPAERTIVNFAEGDVTRTVCDTYAEFAAALREIDHWNRDHGYGPDRSRLRSGAEGGVRSGRAGGFAALVWTNTAQQAGVCGLKCRQREQKSRPPLGRAALETVL